MKKEIYKYILKSILSLLCNRQNIILLVISFLFLLIENKANDLIGLLIAKPISTFFPSPNPREWIFFVFDFIIILSFVLLLIKKYRPPHFFTFITSVVGLYLIYYRFIDTSVWNFYQVTVSGNVYYIDILILVFLLNVVLILRSNFFIIYTQVQKIIKPELTANESAFILDEPWKEGEEDIMSRRVAATRLAEEINKIHTPESFAIGLIGSWGTGKTSFLEMIKHGIKNSPIIVEFNPWKSTSPELIAIDFFAVLKEKLSGLNGQVTSEINKYSKKLVKYNDNLIGKIYEDLFVEDESLQSQFDIINNIINNLNRKVVIIIDDLDRLDKKEIVETLKLIRNTARFYNTIFIAAYDKDYVVNAIDVINNHRKEFYLEKIFQIEINLPAPRERLIKEKLHEMLVAKFPGRTKEITISIFPINTSDPFAGFWGMNQGVSVREYFLDKYVDTFLVNLRDLKRLMNSFSYNYSQIADEIEFEDYLCLEIIKLKCPTVYLSIRERKVLMTILVKDTNINTYRIDEGKFKRMFPGEFVSDYLIETTMELLHRLFSSHVRSNRSVQNPVSFSLYFSNQLFDQISLGAFRNSRLLGYVEFKQFVDDELSKNRMSELNEIFSQIDTYENQSDFELIMRIRLYLASIGQIHTPENILLQLSGSQLDKIIESYYSMNDHLLKANVIEWLKEFDTGIISRLIANIIVEYTRNSEYKFALSIGELQNITLEKLRNHISNSQTITEDSFSYYFSCIETKDASNNFVLLEESRTLFKRFSENHPQSLAKNLIIPISGDHLYSLRPFIEQTFGSIGGLVAFLDSIDQSIAVLEAKTFIRKFVSGGKNPIWFKRGLIEFVSGTDSIFIGSQKYRQIPKLTNAKIFKHIHWQDKIVERHPEFKQASWIAHTYPIDNEQAILGGDYRFQFQFKFEDDINSIKKAEVKFFVDDLCDLHVNKNVIVEKVRTTEKEICVNEVKIAHGENIFDFFIENDTAGVSTTGVQNPYGIVFVIKIETIVESIV